MKEVQPLLPFILHKKEFLSINNVNIEKKSKSNIINRTKPLAQWSGTIHIKADQPYQGW